MLLRWEQEEFLDCRLVQLTLVWVWTRVSRRRLGTVQGEHQVGGRGGAANLGRQGDEANTNASRSEVYKSCDGVCYVYVFLLLGR